MMKNALPSLLHVCCCCRDMLRTGRSPLVQLDQLKKSDWGFTLIACFASPGVTFPAQITELRTGWMVTIGLNPSTRCCRRVEDCVWSNRQRQGCQSDANSKRSHRQLITELGLGC